MNQIEFIPHYNRSHYPLQSAVEGWYNDLKCLCLQHINVKLMEKVKDEESTDGKKVANSILRAQSLDW